MACPSFFPYRSSSCRLARLCVCSAATGLGVNTDLRKNNATATERCARIRIGRTQQCIIFRTAGGHLQQAQCVLPLQ